MEKMPTRPANQLFSIHVWEELISEGQVEWRGRVTTLATGAVAYFRTWDDLVIHMQNQLVSLPQALNHNEQE